MWESVPLDLIVLALIGGFIAWVAVVGGLSIYAFVRRGEQL